MPHSVPAWFPRLAHRPLTLVKLLNGVVVVLSLAFLAFHSHEDWEASQRELNHRIGSVLQRQTVAISDQFQIQQHLVRQLVVQLNRAEVLTQAGPDALQDVLRQYVGLIPGTLDVLLLRPDGQLLSGMEVLSVAHSLAAYCPAFQAQRELIERVQIWPIPAATTGARCPPEGGLVFTFGAAQTLASGSQLWLVADRPRFLQQLPQHLDGMVAQARFRVFDTQSGQSLEGVLGAVEATALPWPDAATWANPDHAVQATPTAHQITWSAASGRTLTGVSYPVEGTLLRVELVYDAWDTLWPLYAPHLWGNVWVAGGLLLVWLAIGQLMQRTVRDGQRSIVRQQRELSEAAQHTQAILDNVVDAVITMNPQGIVLSFNPAAERIFGYRAAQVVGEKINRLMPEPYRSEHDGYLQAHQTTGRKRVIGIGREVEALRSSGEVFPIYLAVSKIERAGDTVYVGLIRDISAQRQAEAEIEKLAYFDPVTSLPNRRLLQDRLGRALRVSDRSGHPGALMLIDLDDFKVLNDSHGHASGDDLLQQVAARFQTCLRAGDTVARLGGDEFVVLAENLGSDAASASVNAEEVAQKLLAVFDEPFFPNGREYFCTGSIGVAMYGSQPGMTCDDLLAQADLAMYQAKHAGRARHHFFDDALQVALTARTALEKDMRQGLASGQFLLHYQPQVDQHGHIFGAEALLRWQHPVRGFVSPAQFIPLAEHTGFIQELGDWVLATACAQLAHWTQQPGLSQLTLAVNVSAHQFKHAGFVDEVLHWLAHTGADPSRLKVELTESTLADDVPSLIDKMQRLKAHGVQFSLDDFGTGYSSLSFLKRLPLQQLKVDQAFVRNVREDASDAAIVRTIVTLGQSLGLTVIAEGVETLAQRDFLVQNDCVHFQGYLFSKPLPLDGFESFVRAATTPVD